MPFGAKHYRRRCILADVLTEIDAFELTFSEGTVEFGLAFFLSGWWLKAMRVSWPSTNPTVICRADVPPPGKEHLASA
jgi:hypothetical protein